MESLVVMINLFGAVALLLFGLAQVRDGAMRALGVRLRSGLASSTRGGLRSFVSGFSATIALQSSTATALMVASFVERDLIVPAMAQVVLLGANVGTAVTAWIVSTGIEWISPLLILIGIVLYRRATTALKGAGTAMIGVGLMLLSLHLLGLATEPVRGSPALGAFIRLLDNAWVVAMVFSAILAVLSSSSLAVVILVVSIAATGALSPGLTVALILGANLGGAVPPVLSTLSAPAAARRVTIGNLIVRGIGCLVMLPFAGHLGGLLLAMPFSPAAMPVDAHLAFNILLAIVAWPFAGLLSRLMARLIADDPKGDDGPRFLDVQALDTPVVALASATREVLGIGDIIEKMLIRCQKAFSTNDLAPLKEVASLEKQVDRLQQEVKLYLSRLGRDTGATNDRRSIAIIEYAINLEHIGDIIEKGLVEQTTKKITKGLAFSDDGFQELRNLFDLTIENLRIGQTIFVTGDEALARQLMEVKVSVRRLEKQSSGRHLERLRDGRADSLQTSSLHLDMLRDLKRINAHIVSVAHPILDEGGLLIESRLRSGTGSEV
ncbi:MAG: Na/Pi cotransporter family protein [Rhizobium sp.]|nr:Na/Pi cotransporter family protein [Rhizobium sp.]